MEKNDTIENVKEMIHGKEDISPQEQCLFFQQKELKNGHKLSDYNISDKTSLRLALVGQHVNACMRIHVKTPTGKIVKLYMVSTALVESVKWKMYDIEGIPPDRQRLTFGDRELENGTELFSNHDKIPNDSVLDLSTQAPPPRNSMPIYAKDLNGRTSILNVEPTETVMVVKHKLEQSYRHKYPKRPVAEDQRLLFAGRQLENRRTLLEYNISRESTLFLVMPLRGN